MNLRKVGGDGEAQAAKYLKKQGYTILEQNFRTRRGEIDIIARTGETVVFVEVKLRRGEAKGLGREAVDGRKQQHIIRTAEVYLLQKGWMDSPVRFDVIEIQEGLFPQFTHLQDAFWS